jgi:GNAT superfamily N-acetyltransferase
MHDIEPSVIARDDGRVIAYLLAMTAQSQLDVPVLVPMFKVFDGLVFKDRPLSSYNYLVVGQVCVDKTYRGRGVFDACYDHYRRCFLDKYTFAVTEIASSNLRSLSAHRRVGFQTIHEYKAPDGENWCIVLLEWDTIKQVSI